jgi:hypothetical protein
MKYVKAQRILISQFTRLIHAINKGAFDKYQNLNLTIKELKIGFSALLRSKAL